MPSDPIETADRFLSERFPDARAAIVGGSVIRGEGTPTSDLDLVIVVEGGEAPYRRSDRYQGWPIESFVHTEESYPRYFDIERGRPSLAVMIVEGVVLRNVEGLADRVKATAQAALDAGPEPLSEERLQDWRYSLTDLLDDFLGCDRREEGIFIANNLAVESADLLLLLHRSWRGDGKWVPRALARHDPQAAHRLVAALDAYYRNGEKEPLVQFAETVLTEAGGKLWEGYYQKGTR